MEDREVDFFSNPIFHSRILLVGHSENSRVLDQITGYGYYHSCDWLHS